RLLRRRQLRLGRAVAAGDGPAQVVARALGFFGLAAARVVGALGQALGLQLVADVVALVELALARGERADGGEQQGDFHTARVRRFALVLSVRLQPRGDGAVGFVFAQEKREVAGVELDVARAGPGRVRARARRAGHRVA